VTIIALPTGDRVRPLTGLSQAHVTLPVTLGTRARTALSDLLMLVAVVFGLPFVILAMGLPLVGVIAGGLWLAERLT
jgi:hypothetical protein